MNGGVGAIRTARRYARLLRTQLGVAAITAMQYRADFLARGLIALLWLSITLIPLVVVFGVRQTVAGWSFPESLVEFFVKSFCPPGGVVVDPFSGSGTTGAVAVRLGRRFLGCDVRQSQVELSRRRIASVAVEAG